MKIVIYQTSDIHGYIYPTDYLQEQPWGLLKIGSYILEDEKKYDASIKIDCGDMIQGSPLANYLHMQYSGNVLLKGMEKIGYDVYVIGNHEFNYGAEYLRRAYREVEDKICNGNIDGLGLNGKAYRIFDFSGFKIAVVGLTTAFIPHWEQEKNIKDIQFYDPVESYAKLEEELKNQADLIIVAYHGGFERSLNEKMLPTEKLTKENQGSELLERFDSIDLLLSGHQHRGFIAEINHVICTQPHHNGISFVKIVIDTESLEKSVELIETKDIDIPINETLQGIYDDVQRDCLNYLAQPIGHFQQALRIEDVFLARLQGHVFVNFLHQVQLFVSKADISVVSLFDQAIGFGHLVTLKDVLMNYPYPNTLKVIRLKGSKIKEAIEKSATYFVLEKGRVGINETFLKPKVQNYNYDFYGGLEYRIDLRLPFGSRVIEMRYRGEQMDMEAEYKVVLSNYRFSNTSVYPCYEKAVCIKEIDMDISTILVDYIHSHSDLWIDEQSNFRIVY